MADFSVDVEFLNTDGLNEAVSRQQDGGGGVGIEGGITNGFVKGLRFAGVIGLLTQLKVVTDSIGFIINGISSLLSFFVVSFIQNVVEFFKDPVRSLLSLAVFIVNGIIDGINLVVSAVNALIPGTSADIPLLANIELEQVLAGYDAAKEALKSAVGGIEDSATAFDAASVEIQGLQSSATTFVKGITNVFDKAVQELENAFSTGTFTGLSDVAQRQVDLKQSLDPEVEARRRRANQLIGSEVF